jgi:putative nucleotidyltransferase with HDIG domain
VINTILNNVNQIPLLPQNVQQLMSIVNNPQASTLELVKIVEQDPMLAMQCLHLCNSAYYSLPVEVTSVSHAVRFLGMDTVAGLAMAAYFQSLIPSRGSNQGNPWLKGLKDHLLKTAYLSEVIAKAGGSIVAPATLFTAGLLHDVGKLVFSKLDLKVAQHVYRHVGENKVTLIEAEQEILGTNHAMVGHQLAIRWQLPEVLMDVIRYHHDPFGGEYHQTFYVFLANTVVGILHNDSALQESLNTPDVLSVSRELGFTTDQITEWLNAWSNQHKEKTSPPESLTKTTSSS